MTGTTGIAETTPAPPIARPAPIAESDKRRGGIATGEALAVLATAASMAALAVGCVRCR